MKFANYATHYECTFRPDSFPIYTRRWLELTEGTGDCWGSDAYQQCVAFQLALGPGSYLNYPRTGSFCRDVVVYDLELGGLEFGVGVSINEQRGRYKRNLTEWGRLTSFVMQEHFSYLARRITCYVWAQELGLQNFKLVKHPVRKTVGLVNAHGKEILEVSYAVPRMIVYAQNALRISICACRNAATKSIKLVRLCVLFAKKLNRQQEASAHETPAITMIPMMETHEKILLRRMLSTLRVPLNFFTNTLDQYMKKMPPGVSALTPWKMRIPKHIQKPTVEQVEWLQEELQRQEGYRKNLEQKVF